MSKEEVAVYKIEHMGRKRSQNSLGVLFLFAVKF